MDAISERMDVSSISIREETIGTLEKDQNFLFERLYKTEEILQHMRNNIKN